MWQTRPIPKTVSSFAPPARRCAIFSGYVGRFFRVAKFRCFGGIVSLPSGL